MFCFVLFLMLVNGFGLADRPPAPMRLYTLLGRSLVTDYICKPKKNGMIIETEWDDMNLSCPTLKGRCQNCPQ